MSDRKRSYRSDRVLIESEYVLDSDFNDAVVFLTGAHLEVLRNLLEYAHRPSTFSALYLTDSYLVPDDEDWDSIRAIVADLEEKLMGNENVIWGFTDSFATVLGGTKAGAGDYFSSSGIVPAGEVWKVESLSIGNMTGARGTLLLQAYNGAAYITLQSLITPVIGEILALTNPFTLKEGMNVRVYQYACLNGDQIFAAFIGYKMAV